MEGVLRNSGLQSAVKKFVKGESEHVIELEFFGGEKTISVHSSEEGSTFEKSSGVLLFESEELSGCLSELGESKMHSPYFSLVLEAVLSHELQFVVDSFLLVRSPWSLESGRIYNRSLCTVAVILSH